MTPRRPKPRFGWHSESSSSDGLKVGDRVRLTRETFLFTGLGTLTTFNIRVWIVQWDNGRRGGHAENELEKV